MNGLVGAQDRNDRLEERNVNLLASAAVDLGFPKRRQRRARRVKSGDAVRQAKIWQEWRTVGPTILVGEAGRGLDQSSKPRTMLVRPCLAPTTDSHHDQTGSMRMEPGQREAEAVENSRTKILHENISCLNETCERCAVRLALQVKHEAPLVS